ERLADLIRPALAWRAGTGPRPEGAFDGAAFTVTPAMMSTLGATAADMEEILKGPGDRAEAEQAAEGQARPDGVAAGERYRRAAEGPAPPQEGEDASAAAVPSADAPHEDEAAEPAAAAAVEPASPDAGAPEEEPKPVLLWRPARHEGRPRHGQRHGQNRGAPQGRGQRREDGEGSEGRQEGRGRFDRGKKFKGKPAAKGEGRPERRNDRPKPREERPARIDPDSP